MVDRDTQIVDVSLPNVLVDVTPDVVIVDVSLRNVMVEPELPDVDTASGGGGGGLIDGNYGDITVSGGGTTMTINPGKVTLLDLTNINSPSFIGRFSGGVGTPENLTLAQVFAAVLGFDANFNWSDVAQVLTLNGIIRLGAFVNSTPRNGDLWWDGSSLRIQQSGSPGVVANLVQQDQIQSGGANVVPFNHGTAIVSGTLTIDCGLCPEQLVTNNGAFTIAAPLNDGSCLLLVINGTTPGAIGFSGFLVGPVTGDVLDTVAGHMFTISIWRINGIAGYRVAGHQ